MTSHISSITQVCATYPFSALISKNRSQEAVDDYLEFHNELDNFEIFAKRLACQVPYCGEWDSEEDFARHIVDEYYDLKRTMGNLSRYFASEAFGRDLFMYDYSMDAYRLSALTRQRNNHMFRVI